MKRSGVIAFAIAAMLLGPNGRACVTCHQSANAMSLAVAEMQRQSAQNGAKEPLFASIDGANCPTLLQDERAPHSLMIDCGLIRIARPWPVSLSPRSRRVKIA